jgi:23S rRNA (adenine2503-C2)-methyltransferase
MTTPIDLKNLTQLQLTEFFLKLGLPSSRARHVFALLHRPGTRGFAEMKSVRREIRDALAEHARISWFEPAAVEHSRDGTVKFAFRLEDGAAIESVLIPAGGRHTLCVSSQAGCAMGCRICLTAGMGFQRNLTPAEIVNQVLAAQEHLIRSGCIRATPRQLIDNLVFMGMGEPLANYDNLVHALTILMDERGQGFSERRITVSTCGLVPRIEDLGRELRVNLAVSLHAADDNTRDILMPVNRTYGVDEVLAACRAYPLSKRQVIFMEYVLIDGLNDTASDARKLAEKLQGIRCRVNLLPYNESPSLPYRCSKPENIAAFQEILRGSGYRTLIRSSRGADISAACGQLVCRGRGAAASASIRDARQNRLARSETAC